LFASSLFASPKREETGFASFDVMCQIYKPAEAKQESASIQYTKDREGKKERKQVELMHSLALLLLACRSGTSHPKGVMASRWPLLIYIHGFTFMEVSGGDG
jgi:long-subunit acyl-CoA synthetase (AMP-forming)